jgi:hypothetical protein
VAAVENVCWVKKQHNNKFAAQQGELLHTSKATMLVCRKGKAPGKMNPIGTPLPLLAIVDCVSSVTRAFLTL